MGCLVGSSGILSFWIRIGEIKISLNLYSYPNDLGGKGRKRRIPTHVKRDMKMNPELFCLWVFLAAEELKLLAMIWPKR